MKAIPCGSILIAAGLGLCLPSCTPGGRSPSGFLTNFSQLNAGYGTEDTLAVYVKPGLDLRKYDSVMIDPVTTVIATPGISPEVTDQLAAYLAESLRAQAPAGMRVVSSPGPTTIRVRMALTDIIEGTKAARPTRTVHNAPRQTLGGKLGSDSLATFISNVCFEGEILDSKTGERLSALSDHRIGAKREASADTSWAAVRSAANQGAVRLWQRYTLARGQ